MVNCWFGAFSGLDSWNPRSISDRQPPASAGLGDVAFGDAQARVGDEVEIPRIRPGEMENMYVIV